MDFGDILDDWDKRTAKPVGKKAIRAAERESEKSAASEESAAKAKPPASERRVDPLTAWLRTNPVHDKDSVPEAAPGAGSAERRRRLRAKAPDASIDLHGLTRDEAWSQLSAFFADAKRRRLEKLRIVHGKGNHSEGEAVLKRTTREFIERCPFAGESGAADSRTGGSGATWVILKD
jgi:DNA-nicking Smr family endonuclease